MENMIENTVLENWKRENFLSKSLWFYYFFLSAWKLHISMADKQSNTNKSIKSVINTNKWIEHKTKLKTKNKMRQKLSRQNKSLNRLCTLSGSTHKTTP